MAVAGKSGGESKGMTLVEFLIATAVLGILCASAVLGILASIYCTGVDRPSQRLNADIRLAQPNAITRDAQTRLIVFDQSSAVSDTGNLNDPTKGNKHRFELRSGRSATWPCYNNDPNTDANVATLSQDFENQYRGRLLDYRQCFGLPLPGGFS